MRLELISVVVSELIAARVDAGFLAARVDAALYSAAGGDGSEQDERLPLAHRRRAVVPVRQSHLPQPHQTRESFPFVIHTYPNLTKHVSRFRSSATPTPTSPNT